MIGASKILTVSYGTFSCTLEGFDEPFNTMKAIAEYFRDLAAEDRYFGAEPPIPDAAMLHKIAEREIHRRVEAKIQENGVILRAGDAMDAPLPQAIPALTDPSVYDNQQDDAPFLADAAISAESVAAKLSKLRAAGTAAAVVMADPAPVFESYTEDQHSEDIAFAPEAQSANPSEATLAALIADQVKEIEITDQPTNDTDVIPEDFAEASWTDQEIEVAPLPAQDAADVRVDLIASEAAEIDFIDQPADFDELIDLGDQDAQDDLARIDGVLNAEDDQLDLTVSADQKLASNDQPVEDAQSDDDRASDDAMLASLGTLIAKDDQFDREELDDEFEDEFDSFDDAFIDDAVEQTTPNLVAAELPSVEPSSTADAFESAAVEEPEVVQRARARVIKIRRADAPPVVAAPQPNLLSDEAEAALQAELAALEAEIAPPSEIVEEPADTDPVAVDLTADDAFDDNLFEAELTATEIYEDEPAETDLASVKLPLNDAFEDSRFEAELSEIAAEIAAEPAPTLLQPVRPTRPVRSINVARDAAPDAAQNLVAETTDVDLTLVSQMVAEENLIIAEPRRAIEANDADQAVGRLMEQANTVFDGADVKRRQSAIAHLKAAVAATEAERLVAPPASRDDMMDSYRSDLQSVVRPNPTSPARVANADRPQPLVLVSAQRIDRLTRSEDAAPRVVLPVRPRRIVTGASAALHADSLMGADQDDLDEGEGLDDAAINLFAETESFADFADRLGASELSDVLEAAAVYCASVLGRPEFSRPLVLRQIATLPATAGLSREDGLRVFGTLMRKGRIAKTRRGKFAVTDRSPLLAEALRSVG